ncbi:lipid IV(A) 3-deoxy-D-manno-octulosonic acid transferase [Limoniibacter endophyticus]|uniref:3-deoxy-D-manno-octulosonic acid transferase n=1 Tax=Limoniibacter endophyticus TaxID=1565040 RepID=A0A8J3GGY3_9HYPH|nr:lipid IV(A) 3-deoxy-D-manno-octulosonic acid transferase [Limoniibacter endophyticus]GHC67917.1 3-deoxy-D-manno-octulosonic acid transferase [Limoniibacter endophyticus]
MSERWARMALSAYRYAGAVVYPFLGGYISWRARKGKEEHHRRRERYGFASVERPVGPLVWVHAASVGETGAVIPLTERLLDLGINVVLTTGTVTSARLAEERLGDRVIHQYVPLDLKTAVSRFLEHWHPDLAIFAESEIWPMTVLELGERSIPQVLVNARLSDRSFASWKKRSYVAEALLEKLAHVIAQSEDDAERFRQLGARPVTVSGNLKVDTKVPPVDERTLHLLMRQVGNRPVWAAISTHDGEEQMAARIHRNLHEYHSRLLTILVPRHPDRADQITRMLTTQGLTVARRSLNEPIEANTDIYLGDTIGEMGLYLRLTEVAYVGRSMALAVSGGQNPLEPAILETAILSGPNIGNFRDSYQRLEEEGAARIVNTPGELEEAIDLLLTNNNQREKMMLAAARTVEDMKGALNITLSTLEPFVHPLVVKSRLGTTRFRMR